MKKSKQTLIKEKGINPTYIRVGENGSDISYEEEPNVARLLKHASGRCIPGRTGYHR